MTGKPPATKAAVAENEVFSSFEAILDEVDRMFAITTIGKWYAMNRVRSRGVGETLRFMERVASLGFRAVVTPAEKEMLARLFRETRPPEGDRKAWEEFQAKLRRMKFIAE